MISHFRWESLMVVKLGFSYFSGGSMSVLRILWEHTHTNTHTRVHAQTHTQGTAILSLVPESHFLSQLLPGSFQVHRSHCLAPTAPGAERTLLDIEVLLPNHTKPFLCPRVCLGEEYRFFYTQLLWSYLEILGPFSNLRAISREGASSRVLYRPSPLLLQLQLSLLLLSLSTF